MVDLASLKVFLMKLWDIDITDRVRPYVSGDGIHVTHADFPKGQHTIKITIADHEGHESSRTMTVMAMEILVLSTIPVLLTTVRMK